MVGTSESDMSHDVFFLCYDERNQPRAYHGCGMKLELKQISRIWRSDWSTRGALKRARSSLVVILEVVMWSSRFQELDCWKSDRRSQEGERKHNEENCNVKWRMTQMKDWL